MLRRYLPIFILFYFIFFFLLRRDKGCILVAVCNQPAWWNVDPGKVIKYVTKTRSLDKSCKQRKRDVPLMLNGISGFIWTIYTFYVVFFPLSLSFLFSCFSETRYLIAWNIEIDLPWSEKNIPSGIKKEKKKEEKASNRFGTRYFETRVIQTSEIFNSKLERKYYRFREQKYVVCINRQVFISSPYFNGIVSNIEKKRGKEKRREGKRKR